MPLATALVNARVPAAWTLGLGAVAAVAFHLLGLASDRLLTREAEHAAVAYAGLIKTHVPDLDLLFESGELEPGTRAELARMRRLGDVLHFNLYDGRGRKVLGADELDDWVARRPPEKSVTLPATVLGGAVFASIERGGPRPDVGLYTRAFVPVGPQHAVIGAVEVQVDQTARADMIRRAFIEVAAIVGALMLLLGGLIAVQARQRRAERRAADERMRYLAEHDVLSGALNRASFNEVLRRAAWRQEQGGPGIAVLCVDLDHFKEVNDSLGHAAGDEVLRQATDRLTRVVRHGDQVARLGGDEFALMQSAVSSADDVCRLAERVVAVLAQPYDVQGQRVLCRASVGAARFGTDATTVPDLLHKADVALYRAKTGGRGRFSFYDAALDAQLETRRNLARDLRAALSEGALSLHYQALYGTDGTSLLGYEALMRWRHPQRGMIPPAEFIPLAEETGQIESLGQWALETACRDAATWPAPLTVSVNLSPAQFRGEKDLVMVVARALDASGLPAQRLVLEITESLLMSHTDLAVEKLKQLSALGCQIAMDDFGTGYSSLAYLWRFPFDKLKIDRAFTQGLGDDNKVALIVRSIVSLAHSMGIRVNAEGVETAEQQARLKQLGCDELQGFLLGRPVPADTLGHEGAVAQEPSLPTAPGLGDMLTQPMAL